jgi:hypothetical protein
VKRLLALVLVAILALALAPSRPAEARVTDLADSGLASCLRDGDRGLAVLFMVDTSQSLLRTDRGQPPARVVGLQAAVRNLEVVATSRQVYIDVVEFSSTGARAFPDRWPSWGPLSGRSEVLLDLMGEFARRANGEDTDYGTALIAGRAVLAEAPSGACRLTVWFTDGEFDLDYLGRPKSVDWLTPPRELRSDADEQPAEEAAVRQICAPGGIADQFRQPGGTSGVAQSRAFVVGVSLGGSSYEFLDRIIDNRDGSCGSIPGSGYRLAAEGVDTLANQLIRASDPPVAATTTNTFTVSESVERLRLRVGWAKGGPAPQLFAPGEVTPIPLGASVAETRRAGVSVSVTRETDNQSSVVIDTAEAPVGPWVGTWSIAGEGGSPSNLEAVLLQEAEGSVRLSYRAGSPLRRSRSSDVVITTTNSAGTPRGTGALGPPSSLTFSVPGAVSVKQPDLGADGTVRLSVAVPADYSPDALDLSAAVVPRTEILPGTITELSPWNGSLGPGGGDLEVRDLPRHPLVDPPASFERTIDQDHRVARAALPVVAIGPESGGCLALEPAEVTGPGAGTAQVRLIDGDRKVPDDGSCSVTIDSGEQRTLWIEVTVDEVAARSAGMLQGRLRVRSEGLTQVAGSEVFDYEFGVPVVPLTRVDNPGLGEFAPFLLLAVTAPVGLLYGYNAAFGARLRVGAKFVVTIPVALLDDRFVPDGTAPTAMPVRLDLENLRLVSTNVRSTRRFDAGSATFRARMAWSPWGAPRCDVVVRGAALVVSADGSRASGKVGRSGLTVTRTWAFAAAQEPDGRTLAAQPYDRTGFDGTEPGAPEWRGTLTVLLPGLPGGVDSAALSPQFDELVTAAGRTTADVIRSRTRKPAKQVRPHLGSVPRDVVTQGSERSADGVTDSDAGPTAPTSTPF